MRLQHVTIENMAGFAGVHEFDLPSICLISGANGRGKSSLLDCLRYLFDRGHDEDMIHAGADAGEIVCTMDDGGAVRARADRAQNVTSREWRKPGERKWNATRAFIDKISAAISYNATSFMELPERKQIEALLELMPIEVRGEEVNAAIGDATKVAKVPAFPEKVSGLELVDLIYESLYDQRKDMNVSATTQEHHALELERALPPAETGGESWATRVDNWRKSLSAVDASERKELDALGAEFRALKDQQTALCADGDVQINREIDEQILQLERARDEKLRNARTLRDACIENARKIGVEEAAKVRAAHAPERATAQQELATAEERAKQHERAEGTRQAAVVARREATAKKANSEVLTDALTRLKDLRLKIAERLPVKNIKIKDGRLFDMNDVPFRRWNTAAQIAFCLRIAVLAHGEAGFVCLDNFEHFDTATREKALAACRKYAQDEGMQFIVCSVSDEPALQVKGG